MATSTIMKEDRSPLVSTPNDCRPHTLCPLATLPPPDPDMIHAFRNRNTLNSRAPSILTSSSAAAIVKPKKTPYQPVISPNSDNDAVKSPSFFRALCPTPTARRGDGSHGTPATADNKGVLHPNRLLPFRRLGRGQNPPSRRRRQIVKSGPPESDRAAAVKVAQDELRQRQMQYLLQQQLRQQLHV